MAVCTKSMFVLAALVGCGDNRLGPDAPIPDDVGPQPEPGLAFFEMPSLPDYNHASETVIAASGDNVVALAIHQRFTSADTFEPPETDDDPDRPFRRLGYVHSTDRGATFQETMPLVVAGRTDPVLAAAADGSFWAAATDPQPNGGTDLLHSTDGGATFSTVASVPIGDKSWIAIDEPRSAVWLAGFNTYTRVGFNGTVEAELSGIGFGVSSAYADADGLHIFSIETYEQFLWDGINDPQREGEPLPAGDLANVFTMASLTMGPTTAGNWIVRALRNTETDAPIVVRVRDLPDDEGSDTPITAPGAYAFMATAALDADGRLHVAWYETQGPFGQLLYAHSETTDLAGAYTASIVVDGNACPGNYFYPTGTFTDPINNRRLREYIGIATSGNRAFITWTHAPEAPSRVRVAHLDF